jgi:hypothetical protein
MLLREGYEVTAARFSRSPGEPIEPSGEPYFVWSPDIVWAAAQAGVGLAFITPKEQSASYRHQCIPSAGDLWPWLQGRRAILLVTARRQEGRVTYVFWDGERIIDPQSFRRAANHYPAWERPEMLEALVLI